MPSNRDGAHVGKNPTLKEQGFYHMPAWRRCRQLALHRDNYQCQDCKEAGRFTAATEVHHVIPLEDRPDLGLEVSNLRSLCHACHDKTKLKEQQRKEYKMRVIQIM